MAGRYATWGLIGVLALTGTADMSCTRRMQKKPAAVYVQDEGFFRKAYDGITEDDMEAAATLPADFDGLPDAYRSFIEDNFSFVDMDEPGPRDRAFVSMYEDMIEMYMDYMEIDPNNLTEEQSRLAREFDEQSGYRELAERFPWVNADNPGTRDKVFLMQAAKSMEIAPYMGD